MSLNVAKRINVTCYIDLFDDELEEIKEAIESKLDELDLPLHVKKTISVEIEKDPFFEE